MSKRLENEIAHGKKLKAGGAESIWNWESPAGKARANRRATILLTWLKYVLVIWY
jgi:hypothetical protein